MIARLALLLLLTASALLAGLARTDVLAAVEDATEPKSFPDFGYLPLPDHYAGRVFRLSQAYPKQPPPANQLPAFFRTDFEAHWKEYMMQVRAYCFEGNVEADWRVEDNHGRSWYHVPWQHYGPNGREGIHGMTKEAPVQPKQLAVTQTYKGGQTYAVGFFNEFGGYTLGRVWEKHDEPNLAAARFPVGTVICKVLFVDVPTDQVPSLVDPVLWQAYITDTFESNNRSIRPLALIQMDFSVRDDRAPSGWLFGTFQYNGALQNRRGWDNLVPLGLQWGNDPAVTADQSNPEPAKTVINTNLRASKINDGPDLPPTHLGWNGRLNGPVDNSRSSCLSCHATAQIPAAPITPFFQANPPAPGSAEWMKWFQDGKCGTLFHPDRFPGRSTDFSLQLAQSIQNFHWYRDEQGGISADLYAKKASANATARDAARFLLPRKTSDGKDVYKIQRSFPDKQP
jgi:hypothetical protein